MQRAAQAHRQWRPRLVLPMLALSALACFCQYSPYAHLITTTEPQREDVVGTYVLRTQTLTDERLAPLEGVSATIELDRQGTSTVTNYPVWQVTSTGDYTFDKLVSGTGEWQIDTVGSVDDKQAWGVRFTPIFDALALEANLTGDTAPHGLLFSYGDPDSGDTMEFEKQTMRSEER